MGQTLSSTDWAKKEILDRIALATEGTRDALRGMGKGRDAGLDRLARGAQAAANATQGLATGAAESGKGFKNAVKNLSTAMTSTAYNQQRATDRNARLGNSLAAGQTNAANMFQSFSDKLSGAAATIPVLGPMVGFAVGAITGVVSQLFQTREAFVSLNQSGIMFGGSVARFNQAMGNAGLSTEQFSVIAQQSGQAIRIFGENRFLQTTTALRDTFLDLGLTIQQGNEYFAEYIENSRLMGSLYMSTREQEQAAFERTIKQQQELAILTGASVSDQRRAARERAASVQYRAMMMALPPEEQARLRQVSTTLASTGMDQKTIEAVIMQGAFGRTLPEFGRLMSVMPREMADSLQNFVRTGNAENQQAFVQTFAQQAQRLQGSPLMQTFAVLASGSSLEGPITSLVNMITQLQSSANLTADQRADLERLRERGRVMDEASRAIGTAQETVTRVLGMISAQINKLVTENVLDRFKDTVVGIGNAVMAVSNAASGEGFRAFAQSLGATPGAPGQEPSAGMRIATAFDTGILAGLGETLKTILMAPINYFMERFNTWKDEFLQGLRDLLPSWLVRSRTNNNNEIREDSLINSEIASNMATILPSTAAALIPPTPTIQAGQTVPEVLSPQQQAAMLVRARQLRAQAEGEVQAMAMGQGTYERQMALQEEANRLMERINAAQQEANNRLRNLNTSVQQN